MYANLISGCPSMVTSDHGMSLTGPPRSSPSAWHGRCWRYLAHLRIRSFTLSPVAIMPTLSRVRFGPLCSRMDLVSAMWCSASTRRDIRETSIRRMNESRRSGRRYGEDRDMPSERFGITDLLRRYVRFQVYGTTTVTLTGLSISYA